MMVSFIILLLVMFLVFMFSAEGVDDSAKRVSLVVGVVVGLWLVISLF